MKVLNRLFIVVTVTGLATMLAAVSAHAGGLAFDAAGNLFERGKDSIFKFTPDGKKSTFASGLNSNSGVYNLAFDTAGNLFVSDEESHSILKFTPDGKRSTFTPEMSTSGVDNMGYFAVGEPVEEHGAGNPIHKLNLDGNKSSLAEGVDR